MFRKSKGTNMGKMQSLKSPMKKNKEGNMKVNKQKDIKIATGKKVPVQKKKNDTKEQVIIKKLVSPYEIPIYKKIWEKLTLPLTNINKLVMITIIIFSIASAIITTTLILRIDGVKREKFGILQRLETLKQTHTYYTKFATKNELLNKWVWHFGDWNYSRGGDPRYERGDCVGAVYKFLRGWNSNVEFENVDSIVKRAKNLAARGELDIRKNIKDIQSGDIIILQVKKNYPSHIGIVYDTPNKYVRYLDVNAQVGTWGLGKHKWGAMNIHMIFGVSYSFWCGNLIKEINKL